MSSPVPESVLPERTGPDATLVLVTRNVITDAVEAIARVVGLTVVRLDHADGPVPERLEAVGLTGRHAVVLSDHDAPDVAAMLRGLLAGPAGYVGMMGSRSRAQALFATLRDEGVGDDALARLHVPVGLNIGGRSAGEIALSVVAELTAWANGKVTRDGDDTRLL